MQRIIELPPDPQEMRFFYLSQQKPLILLQNGLILQLENHITKLVYKHIFSLLIYAFNQNNSFSENIICFFSCKLNNQRLLIDLEI